MSDSISMVDRNDENTSTIPRRKFLELNYCSEENTVIVLPDDLDRFEIQKSRAIEVLKAAHKEGMFDKQFRLFLDKVGVWVSGHNDKIRDALVTLQDGSLIFLVVAKESEVDDELQDSLTSLEFEIANDVDLDLIQLDTLYLPPASDSSIASFIDPQVALKIAYVKSP